MSLLDLAQLAALYDLAGSELPEMLEDFSLRSREDLQQLDGHLASGALGAGAELVHQLKGSSASLGLASLQARAGELEEALRVGRCPKPEDLRDLRGLLDASLAEVYGFLAKASP